MKSSFFPLFLALFFSNFAWEALSASHTRDDFLDCLTLHSSNSSSIPISRVTLSPNTSTYTPILQLNLNNQRFNTPSTPKPLFIVTPIDESQIQAVIYCSKRHGIEMRIRGGGHDFEGLSYVSQLPFVMLDLINIRAVTVDVASKTAWVQGGASLGELYYRIAQKSATLGFPGGDLSTIGVGGHISGGGVGTLMRKYGLAADNVIDARMIDVNGQILDRRSMGNDLFWAIRGGGGSSFGVIVAWKLKLVEVPRIVTRFTVSRTLEENATSLFHKWQYVAPKIDRDLFLRVRLRSQNIGISSRKTIQATFEALFQGRIDRLISLMQKRFPELRVVREDCVEESWIQSALAFSGFSSQQSPDVFLIRNAQPKLAIKGKSDYVQIAVPMKGLKGVWRMFLMSDVGAANFICYPYGGKMSEISESAIPFPHRTGNLYMLVQVVSLDVELPAMTNKRINWLRRFNAYITPYVSRSPRSAYVNYNDLDLGVGSETYKVASIWGTKYFGKNFERLVQVKSKVDPDNFFRHPQSIPSF